MIDRAAYWKIVRPFFPAIGFGFGFLALIIIFRPGILFIAGVAVVLTLVQGYRSDKTAGETFKSIIINISVLGLIYTIWVFIGGRGLLGLILAVLLVVAFIIARRWKTYIGTVRELEKIIWGETHDRKTHTASAKRSKDKSKKERPIQKRP